MNNEKINQLLQELIILASKQDSNKTNYLLSKFLEKAHLPLPEPEIFYLCDDCEEKICGKCYEDYNHQPNKEDDNHLDLIKLITSLRTLYCP